MPTITAKLLTTKGLVIRLAVATVIAGVVGAIAAYVRPLIGGPVHYEVIVSMFIILPAICFAVVVSLLRTPWRKVSGRLLLIILITTCAHFFCWSLVYGKFWDDMLGLGVAFGIIAIPTSWLTLVVLQVIWRPHRGPNCPKCGYYLVGTTKDECPECGRPFTLEELHVTREELQLN